MHTKLASMVLFSSLFCGSAIAFPEVGHIPLPAAAKSEISSTDVVIGIQQSDVYAFVPWDNTSLVNRAFLENTGYGGTNLIGALFTSAVGGAESKDARAALRPLNASLSDFHFEEALQKEFQTSLPRLSWLHANGTLIIKDTSTANLFKAFGDSHSDAALFVFPDYRLNYDCDYLFVQILVRLIPKSDSLHGLLADEPNKSIFTAPRNAIYGNLFAFAARVPPTGDRERNIAEWSAQNGAPMRAALQLAVEKLDQMLERDIERAPDDNVRHDDAKRDDKIALPPNNLLLLTGNGDAETPDLASVLESTDADGETLRYRDGSMAYFTNAAVKTQRHDYVK
jgi:hypothetical protein